MAEEAAPSGAPEIFWGCLRVLATGLDRLLSDPRDLRDRRFGVLAHGASLTSDLTPIHLALAGAGFAPSVLFGPEHGFYAAEQDMVPLGDRKDPWTGVTIRSLYGEHEASLRPSRDAFADLELLLIDLQDIGCRYYTFAATAVWSASAALESGVEVWILDRPNPLGGVVVEGNLRRPDLESFVGAFAIPVRHGLTLAELLLLEARRQGWAGEPRIFAMGGWSRDALWPDLGLPWIAPSPNMPTFDTALVYPGSCLVEATELSEGRGTTRPFEWIGAPEIEPRALSDRLNAAGLPGVRFVPTYFKPQYQKHARQICGGVEIVVTDRSTFRSFRTGVEVLAALAMLQPEALTWRRDPYEFVSEHPAIDLLSGDIELRWALEGKGDLHAWLDSWEEEEQDFREERRSILLYPEKS